MRIKKYLNLNELFFDLVVFAALMLGLDYFLPGGRRLPELYGAHVIFVLMLAASFFLMLFLADIYKRYMENTDSPGLMLLIKIIFFLSISSIYLFILMFYASFHMLPWKSLGIKDLDIIIVLLPVYPIVWGLSFGFPADELDSIKYTLYIPGIMAIALIPVVALMAGYYINWLLAVPVLVGLSILLAGPYLIKTKMHQKNNREFFKRIKALNKETSTITREEVKEIMQQIKNDVAKDSGIYKIIKPAWENLSLPLLYALALSLWQKLTVEMLIQVYANWKSTPNMNTIFWILIWSGIVPLRILSGIAPPWKLVNTVIASGVLFYYIFHLYQNFH